MEQCLTFLLLPTQIAIKLMELQTARLMDNYYVILNLWLMILQDKLMIIKEAIKFGDKQDLRQTLLFLLIHVI